MIGLFETLLPIFTRTVLPVFLIAAAGYGLAAFLSVDSKSVGRLLFYLATPALVFRSLYRTEIDYVVLRNLATVAVGMFFMMGVLGWLIGSGQDRRRRAAITLACAVPNNGNMGIPISLFAFGEAGVALGTIYYVVTSFCSNTLGSAIASAGSASIRASLLQTLRVPVLYAAFSGLLLNTMQLEIPLGLYRSVDLMADAAVPVMLMLMGIQLQSSKFFQREWILLRAAGVRLIVAPLVAFGVCLLLGIVGLERNIIVLQTAMPTAVMVSVLVTEYDADPQFAATLIFFTTALSIVTLSVLLSILL